jgi:hypothetical protein
MRNRSRMCPQFDGLSQIPRGSSTFARKLSERDWYVSCRFRDETLHNIRNSARLERKSCWPDEGGGVVGSSKRFGSIVPNAEVIRKSFVCIVSRSRNRLVEDYRREVGFQALCHMQVPRSLLRDEQSG